MKQLAIGCDHAGYELKEVVKQYLQEKGYELKDYGCNTTESVDYPDFIHPLANAINKGEFQLGIIICGSGNGVSMVANKHQNVRAALCWNTELAALARQHNDANILSLPARFIEQDLALQIIDAYLSNEFEGGRHQRRVDKIAL